MNRLTSNHIKSAYSKEKEKNDFENHPWAYYIIRPLSFWLTPIFIRIGFSATGLTIFGFIPLITGFVLIAFANQPLTLIIGTLLFNLWYLFDFIDGNIARYQKTQSKLGKYLDSFAGTLFHILIPLSIAIFFYRGVQIESFLAFGMSHELAFFLSLLMVVFFALRKIVSQKYSLINSASQKNPGKKRHLTNVILSMMWISSLKSPLLFVFTMFGWIKGWIWIYSIYTLISFLGVLLINIKNLSKKI